MARSSDSADDSRSRRSRSHTAVPRSDAQDTTTRRARIATSPTQFRSAAPEGSLIGRRLRNCGNGRNQPPRNGVEMFFR